MVYRVYVEKRPGLTAEADALAGDIRTLLGISSLESLRLLNRYDVENITPELFDYSVKTILSEPQLDVTTDTLPEGGILFAVEYLPGQFDQRADSAAQCIQILCQSVSVKRQAHRRGSGGDQKVPHQPRRGTGGFPGTLRHPGHDLRHPGDRRHPDRLPGLG